MGLAKGREVRPCASAGGPRRPTTPSSVPTASTHLPRGSLGPRRSVASLLPGRGGTLVPTSRQAVCDRLKRQGRVDPVQTQRKKSRPESSTPPTNQAPFPLGAWAYGGLDPLLSEGPLGQGVGLRTRRRERLAAASRFSRPRRRVGDAPPSAARLAHDSE